MDRPNVDRPADEALKEHYPGAMEALVAPKGAVMDYKEEWLAWRFMVGGKMFAMLGGDKHETPILTLKLEPVLGEALRAQYPGVVIPGHYMNKVHWNSIYIEKAQVPREELLELIGKAYEAQLSSLSKKAQAEIREG